MARILIAGCGNIGAMYDWDNDHVYTHAKAFSSIPGTAITFFDTNAALAEKVASRYNSSFVSSLSGVNLGGFDCFCISTPTPTHFEFLKNALAEKVKVIVCEKPVSVNPLELGELRKIYQASGSHILVNYFRRFLPSFHSLRDIVSQILRVEPLTNIAVNYHRGFINNCSHALDLVQFLTGSDMTLTDIRKSDPVFDHFENDPTISMHARCNEASVHISGLLDISFSEFEIYLYFRSYKISITDAGRSVRIEQAEKGQRVLTLSGLQSGLPETGEFDRHMQFVAEYAHRMIKDETTVDNFLGSVDLNEKMLKYLNN